MNKEDKKLLEAYMLGFNYELGLKRNLEEEAFNLGRLHAKIGDDISSIDLLSDEEILKEIKK